LSKLSRNYCREKVVVVWHHKVESEEEALQAAAARLASVALIIPWMFPPVE
jgi:hypothetical protein